MAEHRYDPIGRPLPTNWATTDSRSTRGLQPEILSILPSVQKVFRRYSGRPNYLVTVTGGQEWGHGLFSLHHTGYAVDVRTRDLPGGSSGYAARRVCRALAAELGSDYFVQLETAKFHIHIQYRWGIRVSNPVDFNHLLHDADNIG